jgi:hypothetical protein
METTFATCNISLIFKVMKNFPNKTGTASKSTYDEGDKSFEYGGTSEISRPPWIL